MFLGTNLWHLRKISRLEQNAVFDLHYFKPVPLFGVVKWIGFDDLFRWPHLLLTTLLGNKRVELRTRVQTVPMIRLITASLILILTSPHRREMEISIGQNHNARFCSIRHSNIHTFLSCNFKLTINDTCNPIYSTIYCQSKTFHIH